MLKKYSENHFYCYLGVSAQNVPFIEMNYFCQRNLLRPILTWANTPNGFFGFISHFSNISFPYLYFLGNRGVEGAMCKILELYDQNPWRNNLSKLLTFDPILQWPYSALAARSRPLDGFDYWSLVYKDSNWRGMFLVLWCIIVVSFNSRMLIPTCVSLN